MLAQAPDVPQLGPEPHGEVGDMLIEFYNLNNLYGHGLDLLACFLRIRQKWQQSGEKKQGVTYLGSAFRRA